MLPRVGVLTVVVLSLASSAFAVPITWSFTGIVDYIVFHHPLRGAAFQGSFTFDSEAVDQVPDEPEFGRYDTGAWTITFPALETTWSWGTGFMDVAREDDIGCAALGNCLTFGPRGPVTWEGIPPLNGQMILRSTRPNPTDALPVEPPPLSTMRRWEWRFPSIVMAGPVTSIQSVPEPSTLSMLGLSWLGWLWHRRRRRAGDSRAPNLHC